MNINPVVSAPPCLVLHKPYKVRGKREERFTLEGLIEMDDS